jgi:hypothetical protein
MRCSSWWNPAFIERAGVTLTAANIDLRGSFGRPLVGETVSPREVHE